MIAGTGQGMPEMWGEGGAKRGEEEWTEAFFLSFIFFSSPLFWLGLVPCTWITTGASSTCRQVYLQRNCISAFTQQQIFWFVGDVMSPTLFLIGFLECICVCYGYGFQKFEANLLTMFSQPINIYWKGIFRCIL